MLSELTCRYQLSQMGFYRVSVRTDGGHDVGHGDAALLLRKLQDGK